MAICIAEKKIKIGLEASNPATTNSTNENTDNFLEKVLYFLQTIPRKTSVLQ